MYVYEYEYTINLNILFNKNAQLDYLRYQNNNIIKYYYIYKLLFTYHRY